MESKEYFEKVMQDFNQHHNGRSLLEDFALRVPPFHFCGTVRLTLTVPLISELWYRYRASEMNAVKRCSVTDAP